MLGAHISLPGCGDRVCALYSIVGCVFAALWAHKFANNATIKSSPSAHTHAIAENRMHARLVQPYDRGNCVWITPRHATASLVIFVHVYAFKMHVHGAGKEHNICGTCSFGICSIHSHGNCTEITNSMINCQLKFWNFNDLIIHDSIYASISICVPSMQSISIACVCVFRTYTQSEPFGQD